nr:serine/threonine protein kinase [candidate division Zixibacteria bacterium]
MAINPEYGRQDPERSYRQGDTVGSYRLLKQIASQAEEQVFIADDQRGNRKVTLRLISTRKTSFNDETDQAVKTAELLAELKSPNIMAVYEIGEVPGYRFIAMEYLEGLTLRQVMLSGDLSILGTLEISSQICNGLRQAHANDIFFTDLNPDNVVVTGDKTVKMISQGVAGPDDDRDQLPMSQRLQDLAYFPPEQLEAREIDARSNVFTVGVILYEMITGRRPFGGGVNEIKNAIKGSGPERPSQINPDCGPELERVILRMLEKNPARRYPQAGDVVIELDRIKAALPPAFAKPIKRKDPWNRVVLVAVIILVIISIINFILQYLK